MSKRPAGADVTDERPAKYPSPATSASTTHADGGAAAATSAAADQIIPSVSFLTDVEGNWEYLVAFVRRSEALSFPNGEDADESGSVDIDLADGWHFVFGGDVCDKGNAVGGTTRVACTLVRLKKKYRERVTLLVGNRDCNKMCLTSELHPDYLASFPLEKVPGPYWVPEAKRISPSAFLRKVLGLEGGVDEDDDASAAAALRAANTAANRMKWLLKDCMGAEGEFERRQAELQLMRGRPVDADETASHFLCSMREGGFLREYLELGQLTVIIGDTLYTHGGVIGQFREGYGTDCLGFIPGQAERESDVHKWSRGLNAWYDAQLAEWAAAPQWDATRSSRGGAGLMDYVVPNCLPSVILSRHLTPRGMPADMPPQLIAQLNAGGVRRLVIGHTPHGNCPTVPDNRGSAVSEVQLLRGGVTLVHGQLHDGQQIRYEIGPTVGGESSDDLLVGMRVRERTPNKPAGAEASAGAAAADAGAPAKPSPLFFVKALLDSPRDAAGAPVRGCNPDDDGSLDAPLPSCYLCNVDGFAVRYETVDSEAVLDALRTAREDGGTPMLDLQKQQPSPCGKA